MKFWSSQFTQGIKTFDEFKIWVTRNFTSIAEILQKGISFSDNMFSQTLDFVNQSANTDLKVPHTLGVVPVGYLVVRTNNANLIIDGTTAWTNKEIYLNIPASSMNFTLIILGD